MFEHLARHKGPTFLAWIAARFAGIVWLSCHKRFLHVVQNDILKTDLIGSITSWSTL